MYIHIYGDFGSALLITKDKDPKVIIGMYKCMRICIFTYMYVYDYICIHVSMEILTLPYLQQNPLF
jgi:hypothetical protein